MLTRKTVVLAAVAALGLAACGGSDDEIVINQPPAPTAVPDSAVASSTALVSYLKALRDDETSEPLTLPTVAVAVSETEEPQAL